MVKDLLAAMLHTELLTKIVDMMMTMVEDSAELRKVLRCSASRI